MGAWGLGLLDSDHDADLIYELDGQCGLDKLTEDARKKAIEDGVSADESYKINYSLIAGHSSDAMIAREFLESNGVLTKLIDDKKRDAFGPRDPMDCYGDPRYTLVMVGLGAMSHGCILAEDFLETMREIFTDCGFMRDSLKQIDTALNGQDGYKNDGTPYDIFKMGRHQVNTNPDADLLFPPRPGAGFQMMNTPAPFGLFAGPSNAELIKDINAGMERTKQAKADGRCGQCGSSQSGLMSCGRCKTRKYCNAECQKQHWKIHKLVCGKANACA